MKVLMLGWEYPPNISGGLGTACEGLTQGLARLGVDITFVLPHLYGEEKAPHMRLVDSFEAARLALQLGDRPLRSLFPRQERSSVLSPYWNPQDYKEYVDFLENCEEQGVELSLEHLLGVGRERLKKKKLQHYGDSIFFEVAKFTENVLLLSKFFSFDLIHAHDWMTFPAGVALAELTGKPLVIHVHSLEWDRSGEPGHPKIFEIERLGLAGTNLAIAVSHRTKTLINQIHAIPLGKVEVVHNGIYEKHVVEHYRTKWNSPDRIVLFLGRVTYQKGPDCFVEVAPKVIPHVPNVLFVMSGSGDMLPRLVERVNELGISKYFHFTGFLRDKKVEQMYSIADLYVMPSVSEPFGLTALEAINYDTPAILSRQSGVSEVLDNALKFDFWDVDRLADLIINALTYKELRSDLVGMAKAELKKLHWDASAAKTLKVYRRLVSEFAKH